MKNTVESSEVFTAYATIEAAYWMLGEIKKEMNKQAPKSGLELLIDRQTGYEAKRYSDYAEQVIVILKDMITAKKVIGENYSKDEKALNELLKIKNENSTTTNKRGSTKAR